jgi:hypothetical protein
LLAEEDSMKWKMEDVRWKMVYRSIFMIEKEKYISDCVNKKLIIIIKY